MKVRTYFQLPETFIDYTHLRKLHRKPVNLSLNLKNFKIPALDSLLDYFGCALF